MVDPPPVARVRRFPVLLDSLSDQDQSAPRLPAPLTSFIGREQELGAVVALLGCPEVRLLTLTGPGGIGKTRLALRVIDTVGDASAGGAVVVSLAPVRDPALVLPAMAQALNVPEVAGTSLPGRIQASLAERRLLLLLDNTEHLLDAVAPLVADLLATCPELTVLATSRVRLNVSGERVVPVAPLDPETARGLFAQRAEAVDSAFAITSETSPVIDAICSRLDRLPLAIELAAARVNMFPPLALLARLEHRLDLLTGGPRDAPDRQRDMRAAIAWSHDLLPEPEQVLFRRLGVFVGGFTLDAAAAVGGPGTDALAGVTALDASSLLQMSPGWNGEPRFTMLETIREYALERLDESGDEPAARRRFATWSSNLAAGLDTARFTPEEFDTLDKLEWDIANFREALHWYDRSGDRASMLRMAGSLGPLWATHGHGREG
ncbi:MAG TPA: AAA family ATPase, partial [Thermomicrobiales bacterium]|nr:AAA family ATPase [Thermomicrobiales bacterium]